MLPRSFLRAGGVSQYESQAISHGARIIKVGAEFCFEGENFCVTGGWTSAQSRGIYQGRHGRVYCNKIEKDEEHGREPPSLLSFTLKESWLNVVWAHLPGPSLKKDGRGWYETRDIAGAGGGQQVECIMRVHFLFALSSTSMPGEARARRGGIGTDFGFSSGAAFLDIHAFLLS